MVFLRVRLNFIAGEGFWWRHTWLHINLSIWSVPSAIQEMASYWTHYAFFFLIVDAWKSQNVWHIFLCASRQFHVRRVGNRAWGFIIKNCVSLISLIDYLIIHNISIQFVLNQDQLHLYFNILIQINQPLEINWWWCKINCGTGLLIVPLTSWFLHFMITNNLLFLLLWTI